MNPTRQIYPSPQAFIFYAHSQTYSTSTQAHFHTHSTTPTHSQMTNLYTHSPKSSSAPLSTLSPPQTTQFDQPVADGEIPYTKNQTYQKSEGHEAQSLETIHSLKLRLQLWST